jgi:cation-transporting P-type ATPase C
MKPVSDHRFSVRHRIPTRLRVKIPKLRSRPSAARELERRLSGEPLFKSVAARPSTGSLILNFSSQEVQPDEALAILKKKLMAIDWRTIGEPQKGVPAISQPPWNLRFGLLRVIILTVFTIFHLYKKFILKSPLKPGLVMTGILLGGMALFRRTATDIMHRKLLSADSFLSGAILLAMATGEATAALEVLWIQEVGKLLEDFVQNRSRKAIRDVLLIAPQTSFLLVDGQEVQTPLHRIRVGDLLVAHSRERIPVDGQIVRGEALVNESHISGRAEPVHKVKGDSVFAGTTLQQGLLRIKAQKVGRDTYLATVTRTIEAALAQKAMAERRADKLAARLLVFGIGASAATLILTRNLTKTLSVQLALASPCATVLAASTAVSAALANAAANKVLIKGGNYLERMAGADCICFDKTGTLTGTRPQIHEIATRSKEIEPDQVIAMAAAAQCHHTHPIAATLREEASDTAWKKKKPLSCETIIGSGVKAEFKGSVLMAGNRAMMRENSIDVSYFEVAAKRLLKNSCSLAYVAKNNDALGLIGLKYDLKPDIKKIWQRLRQTGISEFHVVSGDEKKIVAQTARELNATEWRGALLPEAKADYVAELVRSGRTVVMVGDGVNDAQALASADIGIAMGAGGAEAAIEAADIALVDDRLERIIYTRHLSCQTLRVVEQNHWFAVITDLLSAGLALAGLMPPILSGFAHILHTTLIFANSSRLYAYQPDPQLRLKRMAKPQ